MKTKLLLILITTIACVAAKAQCNYIPTSTASPDSLSWSFYGGISASYGCAPIDPNYWMSGYGDSVKATFIHPQSYPTFRVWGMNDDDSASVSVNGVAYPLTSLTASYDAKVVCGLSPGPDGVKFSGGNLVGVNNNTAGNYSYQDIQVNAVNVTTISVKGMNGAGWGFAGVSIKCPLTTGISESNSSEHIHVYPNPFNTSTTIEFNAAVSNAELNIYNTCGQKMKTILHIIGERIKIERDDLPSGIYFMRVIQDDQTIAADKLIITEL